MNRLWQILLIISTIYLSWLLMMVVHEFGHVLHAWLSGGQVATVILHPLAFSRTDLSDNPHPLFVAWGGAVWGTMIPLLLWLIARLKKLPYGYLLTFFAGFCLIANGAYLAAGSFILAGDAGDLMRHGMPQWGLVLTGLPLCALGLYLWNNLGPSFGLGSVKGRVSRSAALLTCALLIVVIVVEMATCPAYP